MLNIYLDPTVRLAELQFLARSGVNMSLYVINVLASQDPIEIADYFAETNLENRY